MTVYDAKINTIRRFLLKSNNGNCTNGLRILLVSRNLNNPPAVVLENPKRGFNSVNARLFYVRLMIIEILAAKKNKTTKRSTIP